MKQNIITIDGFCGSGKSTLAKNLSMSLNLPIMSTGEAHRINVALIIKHHVNFHDASALKCHLDNLNIQTVNKQNVIHFIINNTDISMVDNKEISELLPQVTSSPTVCNFFTSYFRKVSSRYNGIICEGHGLGSGIFSDAKLKFFCEASETIRAQRRCQQSKGDFSTVLSQINKRDTSDKLRKVNPIHITEDMIVINTEYLSIDKCLMLMKEDYKKYFMEEKHD